MQDTLADKGIILVVDDTPTNLEILLDLLENYGFKVLVSEDGESAIEMAEYASPDLILLDILMPEIDGFETCCRLKANPATQDIPIIFMTALTDKVDKVKGLNLGAVDYVTKPLEHVEVLARINIHLRLQNLTNKLTEQNIRLEEEIQQRQQAQEEREQAFLFLQQSEARFRSLVESNVIGILCGDLKGNISYANDAFLEMVGCDRTQLQVGSLRWDEMTLPECRHLDRAAVAEIISSGAYTPYEKEFMRPDGSCAHVMVGGAVLEDPPQTTVNFVLNLTQHKQAEQKIREQAALLDIATDAIFVQDVSNTIVFWNKGAERLYGWDKTEAIGKNVLELLYTGKAPEIQEALRDITLTGDWQGELQQITKDGKKLIVTSRWTKVLDANRKLKSILVVNTDITEKKQLESQFLRAQRMESLGILAGGIAHDLNNVLTPILMAVQLLETKLSDSQSKQWLQILETNVNRGADLIKQVLSFAQGMAGERTSIKINHLIREVQKLAFETFPKSIQIYTNIDTDLKTIFGDATQLHQVLLNLVVNARDAMPHGGILKIEASNVHIDENYARFNIDSHVGDYISISVSDTGIGIENHILERIFEPFFTTKELGKGTGLGLSTVTGIVKSHGGFIKVYSEVGKGTEFRVYLPSSEAIALNPPVVLDNLLNKGRGELILVAEDEEPIRDFTKTVLGINGYRVITAANGAEAIILYRQYQSEISVVLLDMMMPYIDGSVAIALLEEINPRVKIIAVSGLASNGMMDEIKSPCVKTFLSKPYTSAELVNNLQKVIEQTCGKQ